MQAFAKVAVSIAREHGMFVVLDAGGSYMDGQDISIIKGYRRAVVTPNVVEFKRLSEQDPDIPAEERASLVSCELGGVTVLQKGSVDWCNRRDLSMDVTARTCEPANDDRAECIRLVATTVVDGTIILAIRVQGILTWRILGIKRSDAPTFIRNKDCAHPSPMLK